MGEAAFAGARRAAAVFLNAVISVNLEPEDHRKAETDYRGDSAAKDGDNIHYKRDEDCE